MISTSFGEALQRSMKEVGEGGGRGEGREGERGKFFWWGWGGGLVRGGRGREVLGLKWI